MESRERILACIYDAIDDVNDRQPDDGKLDKSPETRLFGRHSKLDSLGLVNLIVAVEENLRDELGVSFTLADERAMSQQRSPFISVRALADYIERLMQG